VAPYVVLVDPVRVKKILTGDKQGGFSPKVAYIFHKQLEEADAIAVNKVDTLQPAERAELPALLKKNFPETEVLFLSARTGEGLEALLAFMERSGSFGKNIPQVDYDTYADGEAELGWLNCTCTLSSASPFAADDLLLELARTIQQALKQEGAEVAHLKMLLHAGGKTAIANLVRGDAQPELSQRSEAKVSNAELILNARVHTDPRALWSTVERCLAEVCRGRKLQWAIGMNQHFKPGRPVPTHRYAEAM
jgi:G3E family GTPase